jgi:multidrug efflux pump subunit AcrA (membrane-fusion protein)
MNASLAGGGSPGPLSERDPGRLHITRRQIAFAIVLAVLAVIAAIYTVDSISSGDQTYAGVVTTSKVYDLNFANQGKVTAVLVKAGQHVNAGQVLAQQDTSTLQSQVTADEAIVAADRQAVSQAASPQLTPAQRQQDQLQVQQAQTALSNAQALLTGAEASGKATVAAAEAAVTTAQQIANADQARYQNTCPNGPVPPPATLTGASLQAAEASFTECQSLQSQVQKDTSALAQAESQVPIAQTQSEQSINQAQATVNSAQAALNTAQYQATLQSSPTNPTALAQAQATLAQAEGQLAQAQQALKAATVVAPDSGVVAEVYGAPGEYLGPDGVHQYQGPSAVQNNQSSGFQLFPQQTTGNGNASSSSGGSQPLVEVVGGQQQVMAQVPESDVSRLPVGHTATVTISPLNIRTTGVVTEVVLNATRNSSSVSYDVFITLSRTVPGLLPGMTASVHS